MVLELGLLIVTALAVAGLAVGLRAMAQSLTQMTRILADMAYRTQTNQYVFHKGDRAPDMYEREPMRKDAGPQAQSDVDPFNKPEDIGPQIT